MANSNSDILKGNKFNPQVDDYSLFIESMKDQKMKFSGLKILDKKVFDKMGREDFGQWLKSTPEDFDGFKEEFELIEKQISKQYEIINNLYTSKNNLDSTVGKGRSLKEMIHEFELALIPLRKLSLVLNPLKTSSTTIHPRTKITYAVIKAYWISSDGEMKRSVNRNVGLQDWKIAELVAKVFSTFGFKSYVPAFQMENGALVDMVISKGDKSWIVEIKENLKDDFINTFVSLELWKLYKEEYKQEFE